MMNTRILIIDDEIRITKSLAFSLKQAGFECFETHNGTLGCKAAKKENPDVILLDIRMPGMNGLEVLEWLRVETPDIPVIMMSAHDNTADAVNAMKMGAIDYLAKPFDMDELILLLKETNSKRQLESEVQYLRQKNSRESAFIGGSQQVKFLRTQIDKVSAKRVRTVLLLGETGVGKAVIARQLHKACSGEDAPFVEIHCATLPENLIETELFGADRNPRGGPRRRGLIEIANAGTLFLDEVAAMPLSVQAKLLTFLESRTYRPAGSVRELSADVMVVAATNSDLEKATEEGRFRLDLYYRLRVMPIEIPPLRERAEDINLLIDHFAGRFADETGTAPIVFSRAARAILAAYGWPGNVRELKNLVERLTILGGSQFISPADLPSEFHSVEPREPVSIKESIFSVERSLVEDALAKSHGRKGLAAERLGVSRHVLKRKMQKLGLQ
ncbi:sigma-54-dependent Fis family transcriptional regulator [Sinorhizobium meliloti]|uniref:sigma-54-dependent transcriptional regulator n=1 Tax=Rhizobium meliloti TaxID=382 RepID=UPI000FDA65B7|nr:sigma-54 dependent transcriptional regulator [Sinorhizobium meliloti]RVI99091.1 sigma-54-dependent Fis family transcriptional regulator [Sinorhizobium meliloti]